nr:CRISPR-associated protein Cas5 [Oleisolibacter albus]
MEVSAPLAMFARPDGGAAPTSYPAPTRSAAKGVLEAIAYLDQGAIICPTHVEICRPVGTTGGAVQYQGYATNYGGPLRKGNQRASGSGFQFFATVLADVCYRIYAEVRGRAGGGTNPAHYLHDLFYRRLRQGRCHQTPALGWKEFTCTYWGPFRPERYEVDTALNITIPSMLIDMWDAPQCGALAPRFVQDAQVVEGVLRYAE